MLRSKEVAPMNERPFFSSFFPTQTPSITAATRTSYGRSSARVAPSSSEEAAAALPPTTPDSAAFVTSTASAAAVASARSAVVSMADSMEEGAATGRWSPPAASPSPSTIPTTSSEVALALCRICGKYPEKI